MTSSHTESECPYCGWTPSEQDALSNDARRYRFIRDPANSKGKEEGDRICEMWRVILAIDSTPEQMDAAIDVAISAAHQSDEQHLGDKS